MINKTLNNWSNELILLTALILAVALCTFVTHFPALSAKAISIDDAQYIERNYLVQNPSPSTGWRFLREVLEPSSVPGYYQPLTMISLMVDWSLGARPDNLRIFHITSLFIHIVNTVLIVILLYIIFGNPWIAALAGMLFGSHPMTVETIAWASERKTLLAAFFAIWSLIFYVLYSKNPKKKFYSFSIVTYILALMSKPTSMPLPAVMLLMDWWPLKRINRKAFIEKIPFFSIALISSVITYISQSRMGGVVIPTEYPLLRISLIICHNIIFYLDKIFLPKNLSSFYPFPDPLTISNPAVLLKVIGTIILLLLLLFSLKKTRAIFTGWLMFFITVLPTMQIIGFSNVIAADKFAYLPSIGLLLIITQIFKWFWDAPLLKNKSIIKNAAVAVIALVLFTSEIITTRRYLNNWQETETLFRYMLSLNPEEYTLQHDLGAVLFKKGRIDESLMHFEKAVKLNPLKAETHNDFGVALEAKGELEKATEHYMRAVKINPEYAGAYSNLGVVYAKQGKYDKAIYFLRKSLQINPHDPGTYNNMGMVFFNKGLFKEAAMNFNMVLNLNPDHRSARYNLARALKRMGKLQEFDNE